VVSQQDFNIRMKLAASLALLFLSAASALNAADAGSDSPAEIPQDHGIPSAPERPDALPPVGRSPIGGRRAAVAADAPVDGKQGGVTVKRGTAEATPKVIV
jgi:hypothetical protein